MDPLAAPIYLIEHLNRDTHNRERFFCGVPELDRYLKTQAGQDIDRNAAVVFVLGTTADETAIVGFYTLAATSIPLGSIERAKGLPRYPHLPAILLGRFALDQNYHGRGLGQMLLMDAMGRADESSHALGASALVVDAKDAAAESFYKKYGFIPCLDPPNRLYIPMHTIKASKLRPHAVAPFPRRARARAR